MMLAHGISLLRIVIAFISGLFYLKGEYLLVLLGIVLAILTDVLDGQVAKRLKTTSEFGRNLDRACDQGFELILVIFFLLKGDFPRWYGVLVAIRAFTQLITLPIVRWYLPRYFSINFREKPQRRIILGSALTLIVFFFYSLSLGIADEALALSKGLSEIALPYVLIPLSAILEVLTIYGLYNHYTVESTGN
ncbi:MAG: CDP-alcohol phosphatidyltransferase family protein [Bacteriovoracaceae bacterium]|nr:CDP-alcohol phosphatidyltransferase family protein [Bacteriovoracaceae bacterium]